MKISTLPLPFFSLGYKESEVDVKIKDNTKFVPFDSSQEPIFPPELTLKNADFQQQSLVFRGEEMTWFRPTSMKSLLKLRSDHPGAKLVVGNTELGIEMKFKKCQYPVMIQPNYIPELNKIHFTPEGITVGAAVTWSRLEDTLKNFMASKKMENLQYQCRVFVQINEMLRWFAGKLDFFVS